MRIRDPGLLRLLAFEYDECALCRAAKHLHLHHIYFRSHGGDDVRANILPLCRSCHDAYHLHRADGIGKRLGEYLLSHRPDTIAYLKEKYGEGGFEEWLTRHDIPTPA